MIAAAEEPRDGLGVAAEAMGVGDYAMRVARAALMLAAGSVGLGANWPQWRGPSGTGVTEEKGFPTSWGGKENTNVLWKVELPKNEESPSSPIVWGDRVFVTTSFGEAHRVTCYARADGKML